MRLLKFTLFILFCFLLACHKNSITESEPEYIDHTNEYSENITVSTPEPFEMFNIAISLTEYGLQDNGYVEKNSSYYEDVQSSFESFKTHPFVMLIQQFCEQDWGNGNDIIANFNNIKIASLYLQLQEDTLTVNQDLFNYVPEVMQFAIEQILTQANLFLNESGFIQFYQFNSNVYQDITDKFKAAIPAQSAWDWLEMHFPSIQYQYYNIPLSPLTGGSHCFELDKVTGDTIYMIVSGPTEYIDNQVDEGTYTLYLFTEIDHNYVNLISDIHIDLIYDAFADIDEWNHDIYYRTPYDTFNEYMTWAVFTLFAYDRYAESEFQEINANTVDNMINNRKFIKFNEFNEELLQLYKDKETYQSIEELFIPILNWAMNQ